eukprot:5265760-Amphidinium_carterae.1
MIKFGSGERSIDTYAAALDRTAEDLPGKILQCIVPCSTRWTREPVFPHEDGPQSCVHGQDMTQTETIDDLMAKLPDVRLFTLLRNPS